MLAALFLISCEGDPGPMGPDGPRGPQGPPGFVGQAFEVEAYFNESNEYSEVFEIPQTIDIDDSDIVSVYWLWDVDEEAGDVWQPLPASVYFDDGGEMQYAFDHTQFDIQLFLYGNVDLGTVGDDYTQEQFFKVVILPVEYVEANKVDLSNMQEVMKAVDKSKVDRLRAVQQ
ncbi:hypothetical protein [Fodinibius roseus]|uniref:hypothetical protein n=1 Tax=Fodinibius roseus TaxID=1194090 RepID=UPI001B8BF4A6|nr:hypothetical protein [Fodinibius roseus]